MLFDPKGNRKYLNALERKRFVQSAKNITSHRDKMLCLTLVHTGCRISEALSLTAQSIDRNEKTLIFRTLKQRDKIIHRAIPLPDDFLKELGHLPQTNSESLWNISRGTGWKIIKDCMQSADITGIKATPKGLRHGFAIACITNKVPLPLLQKWMGHAKLDTTACYLDFVGKGERAFARSLWKTSA